MQLAAVFVNNKSFASQGVSFVKVNNESLCLLLSGVRSVCIATNWSRYHFRNIILFGEGTVQDNCQNILSTLADSLIGIKLPLFGMILPGARALHQPSGLRAYQGCGCYHSKIAMDMGQVLIYDI